MSKVIKAQKIASSNPNVDRKQVEDVLRLLKKLRKLGVKESRYNLTPPFTRKISRLIEESSES